VFLKFYKTRDPWTEHVVDIDSPFMKLLQIEKMFFRKKIIKNEKLNGLTLTNFIMNEDSIDINDGVSDESKGPRSI
jgi:hypothetical protein